MKTKKSYNTIIFPVLASILIICAVIVLAITLFVQPRYTDFIVIPQVINDIETRSLVLEEEVALDYEELHQPFIFIQLYNEGSAKKDITVSVDYSIIAENENYEFNEIHKLEVFPRGDIHTIVIPITEEYKDLYFSDDLHIDFITPPQLSIFYIIILGIIILDAIGVIIFIKKFNY